jgi:hypothetical protein
VGLATLGATRASAQTDGGRQYLELEKYTFATEEQKQAFLAHLKSAAIPALNRLGVKPVGVFLDPKDALVIYALLPHPTVESALTLSQKLLADTEFTGPAEAIINGPKSAPPFKEKESWLMRAFKGLPKVETPAQGPGRVFQLRIYESPSLKTGQKKIAMFNDAGELKIFREVGLNPVFFGEALFGAKQPNLTYMLGFENEAAMKAAWGKFGGHPEWKKLRAMPEYADSRIIRGITNIVLNAADGSQI